MLDAFRCDNHQLIPTVAPWWFQFKRYQIQLLLYTYLYIILYTNTHYVADSLQKSSQKKKYRLKIVRQFCWSHARIIHRALDCISDWNPFVFLKPHPLFVGPRLWVCMCSWQYGCMDLFLSHINDKLSTNWDKITKSNWYGVKLPVISVTIESISNSWRTKN